ncbi:protein kinase domain-containing protein [Allosphingosinicella sp.]|uniref:protein kinase domain-containing protein n=1 Tax=Allosphingosinicella sp. TaxID=2823234 RepID=UPI003783AA94
MRGLESEALAIVEASLELDEGEARAAFVEARTAGNGPLRERVDVLLSRAAMLRTEAFLQPSRRPFKMPERVGPFRITGRIGDGGMGVVARGERDDGVYAQTVAIKFILGDVAESAARERFEAERRILARLDHPSIARIVDGGDVDGQPWLAMEYVDGRPLTEALDEAGADLDRRLAAFLSVCEAAAVAHRNLVVHADIKPANVLMRGDGAIKLLDFGIARLIVELEEEREAAAHPLTRGYAAPERLAGAAPTVAADIYSLGVLLRELLPAAPGPDLDAIVARATATAPADRYPDVAALTGDLRAWRDHYPVAARGDAGWRYRAAKFLRRHRTGAIVTGIVMLLLAGAALIATLGYVRAEQQRAEAERRFDEVRQLSRYMLFDLYDELADSPGTLPSRLRLADTARRYLEQLQLVPDAPADLRLDIARGWRRLAAVEGISGTSSLGRPERAREALARAETEAQAILAGDPANAGALEEMGWISFGRWTLLGSGPENERIASQAERFFARALQAEPGRQEARLGLLTARRARAYDLIWGNRPREAIPVLRDALAALRRQHFEGRLAREARALEVGMLARLGDAVYYAGDIAGALVPYREADAIVRAELAQRPSVVWTDKLGEAKFNLSGTLADMAGQNEAALAEARAGIAALQRALEFGPDVNLERRLTYLYGQASLILDALGRHAEALTMSEQSMALRRRRLAIAPSEAQNRRTLAVAIPNHARMLAAAGRRADACAAVRSGLEQWEILRRDGDLGQRDATVDLPQTEAAVRQYCR